MKKGGRGAAVFCAAALALSLVAGNGAAAQDSDIVVSGIMYDAEGPSSRALVNGAIVKVNDRVGDAEIVAIKSASIVIRRGGREEELIVSASGASAAKNAKAGLKEGAQKEGFWARLWEKIGSLGKKKIFKPERTAPREYYFKARGLYKEAEAGSDPQITEQLYQAAIKHAQYSLESEAPEPQLASELKNIIDDSRSKIVQVGETAKRAEESKRLFAEGKKYAQAAYAASAVLKKQENFNSALRHFHKALMLAQDAREKRRIEAEILEIEDEMESLNRF